MLYKKTIFALLLALLAGTANPFEVRDISANRLALVLRDQECISGANNEERDYFDQFCYIRFPPYGELSSGIWGSQGLWDTKFRPNPHSRCTGDNTVVHYKVQEDGNFVIGCSNDAVDYSANSNQDHTGNYFMAIDGERCELHIFEGTFGCGEGVNVGKEIWSSDRYGPWEIRDRLYKGQIYHGLSYYEMVLNPTGGNLEVRDPQSHGTYNVVWQAKDEANFAPKNSFVDCYAKFTGGGDLILVGIYPDGHEEIYFTKRLRRTGGFDCFVLGFEVSGTDPYGVSPPIDLVAVPCE